jgi:hypothetical protein
VTCPVHVNLFILWRVSVTQNHVLDLREWVEKITWSGTFVYSSDKISQAQQQFVYWRLGRFSHFCNVLLSRPFLCWNSSRDYDGEQRKKKMTKTMEKFVRKIMLCLFFHLILWLQEQEEAKYKKNWYSGLILLVVRVSA